MVVKMDVRSIPETTCVLEDQNEKIEAEISRGALNFERKSSGNPGAVQPQFRPTPRLSRNLSPFQSESEAIKAYGPPRYVAYVLRNQGAVMWKKLGEAHKLTLAMTNCASPWDPHE